MKLLELIKQYPDEFYNSVMRRSITTPSQVNRDNHTRLYESVSVKDWVGVKSIITLPNYRKALEGVIYCMETDHEVITEFLDAYKDL